MSPKSDKKPILKKIAIIAGIVIGLFLITAIILPMVIKIDQFRPKIVEALNKEFEGTVELGELKLRLFGGLGAEIDGVTVFAGPNFEKKQFLSVKDARVKISLFSVLTKKPRATLVLNNPSLVLIKNKKGIWNIVDFFGTKEKTPPTDAEEKPEGEKGIPEIIKNAKVSILLNDALADINDEKTNTSTSISKVNLKLEDVAIGSPIKFHLGFDTSGGFGQYRFDGPINMDGKMKIDFKGKDVSGGYIIADFDCSKAEVILPETFKKSSGIPCRLSFDTKLKNNVAMIEKASLEFHTLKANASGAIKQLSTTPDADITFEVSPIKMKDWHEILFALKKSPITATLTMKGGMSGSFEKPIVWADMNLTDGSGRVDGISPSISGLKGDFS
ncbi:hypothetical protein ACFLRA_03015, partial [Bdellovibrionota bacterium]